MEKNAQTLFATILGAVLLLLGIIGFINNPVLGLFPANNLQNTVHIISGAVLIWAGVWGGTKAAKYTNISLGVVYLLITIVSFIAPAFMAQLLEVEVNDHILHTLIAVASLGVGLGVKKP